MAFHPEEIRTFGALARRETAEIGIRRYIETYAAYPEQAGPQLLKLLNGLPVAPESASQRKVNAFIGWHILLRTRAEIRALVREDDNARAMFGQVPLTDDDIRESLQDNEAEWETHEALRNAIQSDELIPHEYDFSTLGPCKTFRRSLDSLGVLVVKAAVAKGRIQPLLDHGYRTSDEISRLCNGIQFLVGQLRDSHELEPEED